MKRAMTILFWAHLLAIPCSTWAQEETESPLVPSYRGSKRNWRTTTPRATTSLGMPLNAPLSPIAQHVSWGLGLSVGAGYNFTRRHALVGDFLWNWLTQQTKLCDPSKSHCIPIRSVGTVTSLLSREDTSWSCAAKH